MNAPARSRPLAPLPSLLLALHLLGLLLPSLPGQTPDLAFNQANKLYEQGQYLEAASAYQEIARQTSPNATLQFNLGNALYKAGQLGRAIAAYRAAQELDPRDPSLRFNLRFVRQQVSGPSPPSPPLWSRALAALTLNEWTALTLTAYWLWCLLLCIGECRPRLQPALRAYAATCGAASLLLAVCLALTAHERFRPSRAVVVVPNAVVRHGPLLESQEAFQLPDGAEVQVLGRKEMADPAQNTLWLQIQEATGRVGWVRENQLLLFSPPRL